MTLQALRRQQGANMVFEILPPQIRLGWQRSDRAVAQRRNERHKEEPSIAVPSCLQKLRENNADSLTKQHR